MMEEDRVKLGDFDNQDLICEIFRYVPLKHLTSLKIVRASWHKFITDHLRSFPPTTSTGLVFLLERNVGNRESVFIKLRHPPTATDQGGGAIQESFGHQYPYLLDSCNGFLLYATNDKRFWTYHVCRPLFLDNVHQHHGIALPAAHLVQRPAFASLSFDHYSFRVLCFFWDEVDFVDCSMNIQIFSSESWGWTEKKARLLNPDLLNQDGFIRGQCFGSRIYSRRKLYLLWSKCMLIFDEDKEIFKLVRLPGSMIFRNFARAYQVYLSQMLWESEGEIHFSDPVEDGFHIWTYSREGEDEDMEFNFSWRFKKLVVINELRTQRFEILDQNTNLMMGWGQVWTRVRCCMFSEDLQVLYLWVPPGVLISYSFETQKMATVWSFCDPRSTDFRVTSCFPFLYDSLNFLALKDLIPIDLQ